MLLTLESSECALIMIYNDLEVSRSEKSRFAMKWHCQRQLGGGVQSKERRHQTSNSM